MMRQLPRLLKFLLVVLAAALVLLYFYHCPFRSLFGVSCPGCGMTRALLAAVFSDFKTAFAYHPLFPMLIPVGVYIVLYVFFGMRVPNRKQNVYLILIAVVMVLIYVLRLIGGDPVVMPDTESGLIAQILEKIHTL